MTPRWLHTRRWLPRGRLARRTRGPLLGGVWLRCITWWRAPALDAELAAGADPIDSGRAQPPRPAARIGEDARPPRACARRCDRARRQGARTAKRSSVPPLLRRAEVRACRLLLEDLVARLHDLAPLGVEGLALTSLLVCHGTSTLYYDGASRSLASTARSALVALEPQHPTGGATDGEAPRRLVRAPD